MRTVIKPYFEHYENLKAFDAGEPTNTGFGFGKSLLEISDVLDFDLLFLVGEPGYGKTTLMEQIKTHLINEKKAYQYEDGKTDRPVMIDENIDYLVYDALDENKDIVSTFLNLLSISRNKKLKLIISNRTHYVAAVKHLLPDTNFQFIKLLPFDDSQIRTYLLDRLSTHGFAEDEIDGIIQNSKSNSRKSVLSTPRYLSEFCDYVIANNLQPNQVTKLSKSDLFEKVIYFKLNNGKDHQSNRQHLTKRVLERFALVMEIHELNQISKEDFITFLDQTDSNISLIFLNSIDLDELLDRVMKTTGNLLEFEHTEFQEYLAARELCRMGYRFQTVYDLMVN